MKKLSKKNLGIVATIGTTLLPMSCSKENDFFNSTPNDNIYSYQKKLTNENGHIAIPLFLDEIDLEYFKFLDNLCQNIIDDPNVARAFSESPNIYMEKFGYHHPIDIDEGFLNLVLALGDEDVLNIMKNCDLSKFIRVLDDKGYLKKMSNSHFNIQLSKSDTLKLKQLDDYLKKNNISKSTYIENEEQTLVAVFIVYAIAIAVSQAAVAYNAVATINVETVTNVHHRVNVLTKTNVKTKGAGYVEIYHPNAIFNNTISINNDTLAQYVDLNPVINVWGLKGGDLADTYIIANSVIQQEVDYLLHLFEEIYPNIYNVYSKEKVAQLVAFNLDINLNSI